jgi:hypothetical protein
MKKIAHKIIFTLTTFMLVGYVRAQTDIVDLTSVLERFDTRLKTVSELVSQFDNRQASSLVKQAETLRTEAVRLYQNGQRIRAAATLKQAYALLDQAVTETLNGPLARTLKEVDALLQQADRLVLESGNKQAIRLLNKAKDNRERGAKSLSASGANLAFQYLNLAKAQAEQAMSLVQNGSLPERDVVYDFLRQHQLLQERADEVVQDSDNAQVKQVYDQAIRQSRLGETAVSQGRLDEAKRYFTASNNLLIRVIDMLSTTSVDLSRLDTQIQRVQELLEQVRSEIGDDSRPRARRLLLQANRMLQEAEASLAAGRNVEAASKLKLAEGLTNRARRLSNGVDRPRAVERLFDAIESTKAEIAELEAEAMERASPDALSLVAMARRATLRAETAAKAGAPRLALEAVLAAQRLLTRADKLVGQDDTVAPTKETVQRRFEQLDAAIAEAETELAESGQELNRQLLDSAKDIRNTSYESFENGSYHAADEGIQVAFDLVRKSLKR